MNLTTDIYVPIYYPSLCSNLLSMFMYQLTTHGYIPSYYPCLCTNLLPMFVYQLITRVCVPTYYSCLCTKSNKFDQGNTSQGSNKLQDWLCRWYADTT